ncbi:CAP domain-containing protein [Nonomuraea typhae]|uniref:CAP domain-containing protein n=1 Tax=Nonomuraea typhae TaxID=2603600 RepID=UPI0012F9FF5E|nr:CAP domain-containing protein [Nonomuraea typhae]
MWQTLHTRLTQRTSRRRNHLGLLACLCAAVFTGVLIGRLSDQPPQQAQLYLNEAVPPAAATVAPTRKKQPFAAPIPRETTTLSQPHARTTAQPLPTPSTEISGFFPEGTPTQMLGDPVVRLVPEMAGEVVSLTNKARARKGCRPLRVDARLTRSARTHSMEMATKGKLDHVSPDGSSPWERMERAGYRQGAAENIGSGYTTPSEAVSGWLGNRSHRGNILNCDIVAIGVGVASGPTGLWWTQDFGYG